MIRRNVVSVPQKQRDALCENAHQYGLQSTRAKSEMGQILLLRCGGASSLRTETVDSLLNGSAPVSRVLLLGMQRSGTHDFDGHGLSV